MHKHSPMLAARQTRAGMSLVEIMVVIAIIGSITAVLAVNMMDRLQAGYQDATKIQIQQIEQNLQLYAAKHKGKYPSTSDGLDKDKKYFPNNDVPQDSGGFPLLLPGTHEDNPMRSSRWGATARRRWAGIRTSSPGLDELEDSPRCTQAMTLIESVVVAIVAAVGRWRCPPCRASWTCSDWGCSPAGHDLHLPP